MRLRRVFVGPLVFGALCIPGLGLAECVSYGDYLHRVASLPMRYEASRAFVVSGPYAYVAGNSSGGEPELEVVDISDLLHPRVVAAAPMLERGSGVALTGSVVCVSEMHSGMQTFDVANPLAPQLLGTIDTPDEAYDVAAAGGYAYVADYFGSSLFVIDIGDPRHPSIVGALPGSYGSVCVRGNLVYAGNIADRSLDVVDVSNPASPTRLGSAGVANQPHGITVSGNYAYVAAEFYGLAIVDITDPARPVSVGHLGATGYHATDVTVSGNLAFVTSYNDGGVGGGLQVYDVSLPSSPGIIGTVFTGAGGSVEAIGSRVLVADEFGLDVFDAGVPRSPGIIGSLEMTSCAYGIAVADHYAYVCDTDRLEVVDITNPDTPSLVTGLTTTAFVLDVALSGTRACLAEADSEGLGRLEVVDVSNPVHPQIRGSVQLPEGASCVAVSGSIACVCTGRSGLQLIDISNPSAPRVVGNFSPVVATIGVAVSGTIVGTIDYHGDLKMIDISDPRSPRLLGGFFLGVEGSGSIALAGTRAYIAERRDFIVVNVADPHLPFLEGSVRVNNPVTGAPPGVAVSGAHAYVAGGGVQVVSVADPAAPSLVGGLDTGWGGDVAVAGDYVYVTDPCGLGWSCPGDANGLTVIPTQCETSGAPGPPSTTGPLDLRVLPNPLALPAEVRFSLPAPARARAVLYDAAGCRVRDLLDGELLEAGPHRISWDGRDDRGREVGRGIYFLRLSAGGDARAARIVLID